MRVVITGGCGYIGRQMLIGRGAGTAARPRPPEAHGAVAIRAMSLHAPTENERDSIARVFPDHRIEVIPNFLNIRDVDSLLETVERRPEKIIVLMSRLHLQKGVDLLIEGFSRARLGEDWQFIIGGPAELPDYLDELTRATALLGLEDRIRFLGTVSGIEIWRLLRRAWVLAAPSRMRDFRWLTSKPQRAVRQ